MSGIRMIWIMTVEYLLNTDWLGFLGVVAPPIISAWVAYQIARYQIDTQLKKQNELEVKKENRMLVTNIRLDKHGVFISTLKEYALLVSVAYLSIVSYREGKRTLAQAKKADDDLNIKLSILEDELETLILYYPNLEKELTEFFYMDTLVFASINSYLIEDDRCILGKDNLHFEKLTKEYNDFKGQSKLLQDIFTKMISKIISDLENSL